jgi:hypothetical protein
MLYSGGRGLLDHNRQDGHAAERRDGLVEARRQAAIVQVVKEAYSRKMKTSLLQ